MTITLVPSAAYVGSELAAEYGNIPPAFLPIGHRRLYELQLETIAPEGFSTKTYLTLPQSFSPPQADIDWFSKNQVTVINVPDNLELGESILFALEKIELGAHGLNILHGDTLIYDLPVISSNKVAIGFAAENYVWGSLSRDQLEGSVVDREMVLAGYFSFGDAEAFREALIKFDGHFLSAVNFYDRQHNLMKFTAKEWLDFGHLQTFYRARCEVRTQRAFNELSVNFREVRKSGLHQDKIRAEANWYAAIPLPLRSYVPALLGFGENPRPWYKSEYLPIPSLHELFVFGEHSDAVWKKIIDGCFTFLMDCIQNGQNQILSVPVDCLQKLSTEKTLFRVEEFCQVMGIVPQSRWAYEGKLLPSLYEIIEVTTEAIDFSSSRTVGVMHGDLCFTNIFYDFRTQKIQVIDPRGTMDGATHSIMGDIRYDLAKLNHSIAGYDFILANRFQCHGFEAQDLSISFQDVGKMSQLESIARSFRVSGVGTDDLEISALTIHLFLSMLPLHQDRPDRQKAFLANALRLFSKDFI